MFKTVKEGLTVESLKSEDYKFLIEAKIEALENQADNLIDRDILYNLNEMESFLKDIELELILGANQQTQITNTYPYFIQQQLGSYSLDVDSMLDDYSESQRVLLAQENLMMENYLNMVTSIIGNEISIISNSVEDDLSDYMAIARRTIDPELRGSETFFKKIWNAIKDAIAWIGEALNNLLIIISGAISTAVQLIGERFVKKIDLTDENALGKIQDGFNLVQNLGTKAGEEPQLDLDKAEEEYAKSKYEFEES